MMSKKQWFALLCILVTYLLLGACFYHQIESREEEKRRRIELREMQEIEVLLEIHYQPSPNASQDEIFKRLTNYCGKPMHSNMSQAELPLRWDFYHSLFFVITVVSTIGYGNLAPTTMFGRIFMIFYALVGIPINGIVMVTLGDFFAKNFKKLYTRWKKSAKINHISHRVGLVGQIGLYLIPGFTFFIFIPSVMMMYFEGWDYDVAVYYAFVTLTTIGFGDYVAGTQDNGWGEGIYACYKIFLLVWIIIGLGYVVMVMGFISSGLRHKKVHELEHVLSQNIRNTTSLMLKNMKNLLNQLIIDRDVQPVYKAKKFSIAYQNVTFGKAYSVPDLTDIEEDDSYTVKRRNSDSDLLNIDKEATFKLERNDLLSKIDAFKRQLPVNLQNGLDMFSEQEILATERRLSQLTLNTPGSSRDRSTPSLYRKNNSIVDFLDVQNENEVTWYGQTAALKEQEMRERLKHGRPRSRTLPVQQEPLMKFPSSPGLLSRIKNSLVPTSSKDSSKEKDIEKQEIYENTRPPIIRRNRNRAQSESVSAIAASNQEQELQEVINLLLTFANLPSPGTSQQTNSSNNLEIPSANRCRRQAIRPVGSRRSSLVPPAPHNHSRRFSLMPSQEDSLMPPPPYTPLADRSRRFSRPAANLSATPSPVQRHRIKNNVIKENPRN